MTSNPGTAKQGAQGADFELQAEIRLSIAELSASIQRACLKLNEALTLLDAIADGCDVEEPVGRLFAVPFRGASRGPVPKVDHADICAN